MTWNVIVILTTYLTISFFFFSVFLLVENSITKTFSHVTCVSHFRHLSVSVLLLDDWLIEILLSLSYQYCSEWLYQTWCTWLFKLNKTQKIYEDLLIAHHQFWGRENLTRVVSHLLILNLLLKKKDHKSSKRKVRCEKIRYEDEKK